MDSRAHRRLVGGSGTLIKPLLLIDVDGVLNPAGKQKESKGWGLHKLAGFPVWLNPKHGEWLNDLASAYDLTWATTWEDEANEHIAPLLGLPQLPVIKFTHDHDDFPEKKDGTLLDVPRTWKLSAVREYVGDRPLAWIDDDLQRDAVLWAMSREGDDGPKTLLLKIDPGMGLLEHHVKKLRDFAESL